MKSKTPMRISLGLEESLLPGSLSVNRICVEPLQSGASCSMEVFFISVREIFEKHGSSSEYVILIPMTRLQDQSEHFRSEVESEALKAGVDDLVFENPHAALEREARACLDPDGVEARSPAMIIQVAVTREGEVIIAGNSSADAEIPGGFLFKSRPGFSANDNANDSAIEAVLSEAVLFIERALSDQDFTQVILAAETTGISRSVMNQLHRMLKHLNVEIHAFKNEDRLKGALIEIEKRNRPREADQHLRDAEAKSQAGDYRGAYVALQAAIEAHPCDLVLNREADFFQHLRAAASMESGTQIKRFLASIESDPTRLVDIWQDIAAVESRSGSRAAATAQLIANFIQGGNAHV